MYYRWRMYAPGTGRFVQRDPLGYVDGPNTYAYVYQLPTSDTDAFGLRAMRSPPTNMGEVPAMGGDWTRTKYESRSPTAQAQEECKTLCAAYDRYYVDEKSTKSVGGPMTINKTARGWVIETVDRGGHRYYYKYELSQEYSAKVQEKKTDFDCICEQKTTYCGFTYYKDVKTIAISANWLERIGDRKWRGKVSGTAQEVDSGQIH
jgi:uncharacterized protein RhaS with RHS repeats